MARTLRVALAALYELQDAIDAVTDDLGNHAPVRQRAVMTGWVAEARSIEDEFRGERSVVDAVRRIVGTLARLSKAWWPGPIRAIAYAARPSDAADDLAGAPLAATTWPAVEALAERTSSPTAGTHSTRMSLRRRRCRLLCGFSGNAREDQGCAASDSNELEIHIIVDRPA